ncbi:MAG: hypothetical protein ACKODH_13795, partial [Limisphaerales bacterium]
MKPFQRFLSLRCGRGEEAVETAPASRSVHTGLKPGANERFASCACVAIALLLLSGCATYSDGSVAQAGSPAPSTPRRDQVLWSYRNAALAMRAGRFDQAKTELDDAISRLGGILGPNTDAASARRLFNEEAKKMFIGEPYERVMAYYYR